MKISIITVCYNSEKYIRYAIESVLSQSYDNVEYIIVDGASSDSTMSIINEYSGQITHIVSEPDSGIYDAMNKGIALASGDVIGILNSDDFYFDERSLEDVVNVFENQSFDACYADLLYVEQKNTSKAVRFWKSGEYKKGSFLKGWMPPHPTFFCRKSIYDRYGSFNLDYKIAADVEILFRFLEKVEVKTAYIPKVLIKMRMGGTTNNSFKNLLIQNREILSCFDTHYGRVSRLNFFVSKFFNRFGQYLFKQNYTN